MYPLVHSFTCSILCTKATRLTQSTAPEAGPLTWLPMSFTGRCKNSKRVKKKWCPSSDSRLTSMGDKGSGEEAYLGGVLGETAEALQSGCEQGSGKAGLPHNSSGVLTRPSSAPHLTPVTLQLPRDKLPDFSMPTLPQLQKKTTMMTVYFHTHNASESMVWHEASILCWSLNTRGAHGQSVNGSGWEAPWVVQF